MVLALLMLVAPACSADPPRAATPHSRAASPSASPCPAGSQAQKWPATVPAELPVPPGLQVLKTGRSGTSDVISFRTSQSIKEAAVSLAQRLPAAGFTLRGGDSEADEVDQPFTGHGRRGAFKLQAKGPCVLEGVLVISPSP